MIGEEFREITDSASELESLPLEYAKAIRKSSALDGFTLEKKKEAMGFIRAWMEFIDKNKVDSKKPFAVRYAITRFAKEQMGEQTESNVRVESVDINNLRIGDQSYIDLLAIDKEVFSDPDVGIYGGSARLALKMHAGVSLEAELPVSDIDLIVHDSADVESKAEKYGSNLAGTRIVGGENIESEASLLFENIDCTMNQYMVYNGKLYYTPLALNDAKQGNICTLSGDKTLFAPTGVELPGGNTYLTSIGFYRGLAFLLRGKGERLLVSQENLDLEKDKIGRYWLVLFYAKLFKMSNPEKRDTAVIQWYEIAKKIGSTNTESPLAFLIELKEKFPEINGANFANDSDFDTEKQVKWIINKLLNRVGEKLANSARPNFLPTTYTPADIELSEPGTYDLKEFYNLVQQ